MSDRIDMVGKRFGRWLVLSYSSERHWLCACDCGTQRAVSGSSLRRGASRGCSDCHPARKNRRTHGAAKSRLYTIWLNMRRRCEDPRDVAFSRYGLRGIRVCHEWLRDFIAFRDWAMAAGYNDGLTIDRIDNARGYEPGNCRWATYSQQNRNYSRNRPIQFRGELVLIGDLAERHGMPADIVKNRVRRYGWTIEEALTIPVMRKGQRRVITFAVHKANIDAMEKAA